MGLSEGQELKVEGLCLAVEEARARNECLEGLLGKVIEACIVGGSCSICGATLKVGADGEEHMDSCAVGKAWGTFSWNVRQLSPAELAAKEALSARSARTEGATA